MSLVNWPRLSEMDGYLVVLRPVRFETVPGFYPPALRVLMCCDIVAVAAPRGAPEVISANGADYPLPHVFRGAYVGAQGLVDGCESMNRDLFPPRSGAEEVRHPTGEPRPAFGRVYRYELREPRPGQRRSRGWSLAGASPADMRLIESLT